MEYEYDALNNVTARYDMKQNVQETFGYDDLNRLTNATVVSNNADVPFEATTSYQYDALGNMASKSDVGSYAYGDEISATSNAGPHALSHACKRRVRL